MLSFKVYLENRSEGLIPTGDDMTLEEFLEQYVGMSRKAILDKVSYARLYIGNKHGVAGPGAGKDADITKFVSKLTNFINKDILKHRPKERVYDTEEFRNKHNYAEYDKLNKERAQLFRDIIRAKSSDEKELIRRAKSVLEDKISNTEYRKAVSEADKEYDRQVDIYHNTPLSKQELLDDGSEQYKEMEHAYNKLIGKEVQEVDDDVIDV